MWSNDTEMPLDGRIHLTHAPDEAALIGEFVSLSLCR
jgi:hypothetical protein